MKILVIGIRAAHARKLERLYPLINFTFKTDGDRVRGKVNGDFEKVYALYKFTNHTVEVAYGSNPDYVRVMSYTHLLSFLALLEY
jgi:hypothetical protein